MADEKKTQPEPNQTKPEMIDRLGDRIERNHSNPGAKIGAGHPAAMFRAGIKELSQILPAFPDGVRPVEEPGLAGNPTNIEVVDAKEIGPPSPTPTRTNPLEDARRLAIERSSEPTQVKQRQIGD